MKINQILTTLSTLREPIKRSTYAIVGISLALVKYLGDTALIWFALHRLWLPTDYLHTVHSLLDSDLPGAPGWLAFALMLWTIPFVWIGVSFTLRRALDAGWSPWLCLLFFVPFVTYLLMLLLCLWPSSKNIRWQASSHASPPTKVFSSAQPLESSPVWPSAC